MTKLASTTVGVGGVASVTFSNIPQGYTDLKVVVSSRIDYADVALTLGAQFNGDTGANYTSRYIRGSGAAAISSTGGTDRIYLGLQVANTATANTFGNLEMYIPNYTSSNYKSVSVDSVGENNATTAYSALNAGLWSSTSAITSVTIFASYNLMQYSTFTLYGIKNAAQTAGNSIKATGGNIVFDGTYVTHTFNTSGSFIPTQPILADYLVIAGGGGGSGGGRVDRGGGGDRRQGRRRPRHHSPRAHRRG
jgi:hypothetical protein